MYYLLPKNQVLSFYLELTEALNIEQTRIAMVYKQCLKYQLYSQIFQSHKMQVSMKFNQNTLIPIKYMVISHPERGCTEGNIMNVAEVNLPSSTRLMCE